MPSSNLKISKKDPARIALCSLGHDVGTVVERSNGPLELVTRGLADELLHPFHAVGRRGLCCTKRMGSMYCVAGPTSPASDTGEEGFYLLGICPMADLLSGGRGWTQGRGTAYA